MNNLYFILFSSLSLGAYSLNASDTSSKTEEKSLTNFAVELPNTDNTKKSAQEIDPKIVANQISTPSENLDEPSKEKERFKLFRAHAATAFGNYLLYLGLWSLFSSKSQETIQKGALRYALDVPAILDTIYRIPYKIGRYSKDRGELDKNGIATFFEDALASYAVSCAFYKGIYGDKIDHPKLLWSALFDATRLSRYFHVARAKEHANHKA